MILSVTLENFRGHSTTYNFGQVNLIYGKNQSGKTTIREAIAFAFTGCDAAGNRAPVHLISWQEESTKVTVKTEQAVIQRTLTKKKNSTLKVVRGDIPHTLSQAQLEELLGCTADCFLTVFVPGYFWTLPLAKQQSVLSEVMPPFDVTGFITHFTGTPLNDMEAAKFDFSRKRPDLVASAIAGERRNIQRLLDINEGKIRAIESMHMAPTDPGPEPVEASKLAELEGLKSQWVRYNAALSSFRQADAARNSAVSTNAARAARRAELEAQLKELPALGKPLGEWPRQAEYTALSSSFIPTPNRPETVNVVESDNCPTCGQVVGLKHRERCREENAKRASAYEEELNRSRAHNAELNSKLAALQAEEAAHRSDIRAVEDRNAEIRRKRAYLEGELAGLSDVPVPECPPAPTPPSAQINAEQEQQYRLAVDQWKRRQAEFDYAHRKIAENQQELARVRTESAPLAAAKERFAALEAAAAALPEARLKQQAEALLMEGYEIVVEESAISYRRKADGCPYALLSTGHLMRSDVAFAAKLNSLMRRPVKIMFVDNADLVDERLGIRGVQVFCAYVKHDQEGLRIEQLGE